MKIIIIGIFIFGIVFNLILNYLSLRSDKSPIPVNILDVYNEEEYKKRNEYHFEGIIVDSIKSVIVFLVTLSYLIFNVHALLFNFISKVTDNIYFQSYFMFGVLFIISSLISIPFSLYNTFKIEEKYGFNKSTGKLFVSDLIKEIVITVVLLGGVYSLFVFFYQRLGNNAFFIFYFALIAILLIVLLLYQQFAKLFNEFTPLEEGDLRTAIEEFCKSVNYSIKNIFAMNASKRSTKSNAYFSGLGATKSIVLYDTVIKSLNIDEIIAVLAHEIGHDKGKHKLKGLIMSLFSIGLTLFLSYFIITNVTIASSFGFFEYNLAFGFYIFLIIYSPVSIVLSLPSNYLSRKREFQADKYAYILTKNNALITALKKVTKNNYSNLNPNHIVVLLTYSHPPLSKRIEALSNLKNHK